MTIGDQPAGHGDASSRAPKRNWYAKPKPHLIEILLTGAIVIVGLVQACILIRQTSVMRDYNRQNAITNRAFVNSNGIRIEEERQDGSLVGWRYVAMIENSGNTPTKDGTIFAGGVSGPVRVSTFIAPSYPIGVEPTFIDPEFSYYTSDSNPISISLGAHASADIARIEISTTQAAGMRQGKPITTLAYLAGIIFYFDHIDPTIRHKTKFCYVIGPASSLVDTARPNYDFCGYWNCTDDECKADKRRYRAAVQEAFKGRGMTMPSDFFGSVPND